MKRVRSRQREPERPILRPLVDRVRVLSGLLGNLHPVPAAWLNGAARAKDGHIASSGGAMECAPCDNYRDLRMAWRRALKWTPGLDHALTTMLASVASTMWVGDQLWVKVVGPASCGKSCLCEALSVNKDYILAKSTIRGFHSGFSIDNSDDEDHSLLARLSGKTLVTKDGDTLLQSPNLPQILSEARDVYDGVSRTHYRNSKSKDYEGVRMTWILCGTSSLRSIDSSELGERFLDCVISEGVDDELEDAILNRVVNKAEGSPTIEDAADLSRHHDPDMTTAMQMTGGYVGWLRENLTEELDRVEFGETARRLCMRLGKFVAYARARPSQYQEETAERELAARLVSQLVRLTKCLALVLNKRRVDDKILGRVRRVALDTGRGVVLEIARNLRGSAEGGTSSSVALALSIQKYRASQMLLFLKQLGVTETFAHRTKNKIRTQSRWRLTERFSDLYDSVVLD